MNGEFDKTMNMTDALNSRAGIALGLSLSRAIQPNVGYRMARWVADLISSRRRAQMVRAVRANQWVVHNQETTASELDRLVSETFRSSARSLYEFWHNFRDPKTILKMVDFDQSIIDMIKRAKSGKSGTLVVTSHISNFDLIGRAAVLRGLPIQILSYPQPPGGYRWQNAVRQIPGLRITPMSIQALREASETLRNNQTVVTVVDRPLPDGENAKYQSRFFGRLAALPVFHIRLALKHNLPITVVGTIRQPNGCYRVWASEPISLKKNPDLIQETVENAETILAILADVIRRAPEQWAMFYPVWPETLDAAPA